MYLQPDGSVMEGPGSSLSAGAPAGCPARSRVSRSLGRNYGSGKLTWAEVCEPARRLAADGHVVSQGTSASLRNNAKHLGQFAESKRGLPERRRVLECR